MERLAADKMTWGVRSNNNSDTAMIAHNRFQEGASRHLPRVVIHVSAAFEFVNTWGQSAVTKSVTYRTVQGIFRVRKRPQNKTAFRMSTFIKIKEAHNTVSSAPNQSPLASRILARAERGIWCRIKESNHHLLPPDFESAALTAGQGACQPDVEMVAHSVAYSLPNVPNFVPTSKPYDVR